MKRYKLLELVSKTPSSLVIASEAKQSPRNSGFANQVGDCFVGLRPSRNDGKGFLRWLLILFVIVCFLLAACAPPPPPNALPNNPNQPQAPTDSSAAPTAVLQPSASTEVVVQSDAPHTSDVDLTHLQVGDGKYSTRPQTGYVFSCQTQFTGGGVSGTGNWMNGDGTWDATKKAVVDGSVNWPHSFSI